MLIKLLDYGKINPFRAIVGRPRNLAWPIDAYRVTLPIITKDSDSLNPFERIILKMLDAGSTPDTKALSKETCIPADLIQCVFLRLQDKAFLDEHNKIVQQTLSAWENKKDKPPIFVTALLFRERATNRILPFLHLLDENNPLKKKETEDNKFRKISPTGTSHNKPKPSPSDVITTLRTMKKRSKAFGDEIHLPPIGQIEVLDDPEEYYLDCPIALLQSDDEFRIADPFGYGYSRILENAFSRLLEEDNGLSNWFVNWRDRLSRPNQQEQTDIRKEAYDNEINQKIYPNLLKELRLPKHMLYRSIEQIHAVLEWTLFHVCVQSSYNVAVGQLKFTNQIEHPKLLENAATKSGFTRPITHRFHPIPLGRVKGFLDGKADMVVVLGIALLMAENDATHPLRYLVDKHPDFIDKIFSLKQKRDKQAHGEGKKIKEKLNEEGFMCDIVSTLLPSIKLSPTDTAEVKREIVEDYRFDARTNIQIEFGFRLFNRLGEDLQSRLIAAESFWLSCDEENDGMIFVRDLYAILQSVFQQRLSRTSPRTIEDSELIKLAQQNAAQSGLEELPKSLREVEPFAIRKTLQGEGYSLGSCVIALLLLLETEALQAIAESQPSFLYDLAAVIEQRGHGNEQLPLSKKDIKKTRKFAYLTIKALLEI